MSVMTGSWVICKYNFIVFLDSSMAEHSAVNRRVVGSSPTRGALKTCRLMFTGFFMYRKPKRYDGQTKCSRQQFHGVNDTVKLLPGTFEGFNLNLQKEYGYLKPVFTMGKYYQEAGRVLMPLAIQVHHAVCDGVHVCRFIDELQKLINHSDQMPKIK